MEGELVPVGNRQPHSIFYWLRGEDKQNFGDFLSELFVQWLFTRPRILASAYRLIGSAIDDEFIRNDLGSVDESEVGRVAFWCCGARDDKKLSRQSLDHCTFLGVRGPLTRDLLELPKSTVIGDPALLLPVLYRPMASVKTSGKTICVPHFHDKKSDEDLLTISGADVVIRPAIKNSIDNLLEIIDDIASARFVLAGSLHAAIVACAYDVPFCYWDDGHVDLPFKWRDFSASVNITACFVDNVVDGIGAYDTLFRKRLQKPLLYPILGVAPFYVKAPFLLTAAAFDAARSGSEVHLDVKMLEGLIQQTELAQQNAMIADLLAALEQQKARSLRLEARCHRLEGETETARALEKDLKLTEHRLHQYEGEMLQIRASALYGPLWEGMKVENRLGRIVQKFLARSKQDTTPTEIITADGKGDLSRISARLKRSLNYVAETIQRNLFSRNGVSPHRGAEISSPPVDLREAFMAWHGRAAIYFPPVTSPEVSVIIPAYRGAEELKACLRSLSANRATEPSFEVIVLDDCPDVPVLWDIPSSGGLVKISNEKNLGFLLTCNRGAAAARGRVLCFLNSDTIVSPGWLRSLLEVLKEEPRAAMVGGMLLNTDGTIQDAGWTILDNGWGYSIGRGADPNNGSFTYRRSVDCVTGACFVMPREIWNELGGFDTIYAPAFYEEFDLAFRARAKCYQIIYEPRSRVLHLGSASYGAQRRDQLSSINQAKFCERFAEVLRKHPADTLDDFTLRHGSGEGPVLLVIDLGVPQPDQHAGDVTMSKYLAMFAAAGWRLIFYPANGRAEGPSAEALERLGIELIRAPVTIEAWLAKYGKHVRDIWLARPEVAEKVLPFLRALTNARIIYYTHDLHYLRMERQAELLSSAKLKVEAEKVKAEAAKFKATESDIFHKVDHVTTPSVVEAEIVRKLSPETPVTALPPYHYDTAEILTYDAEHFSGLSDIIFVGGFPHVPNVDAALFIVNEVMPLVWEKYPEVRLLLIGYAPPIEVQALAGPRVLVTGQVPKLESFFCAARVFLGALRYGAGVKGKIVEALRMGLPVVTTSVGAEGIGMEPGYHAVIAEDASTLADGVLELLKDAERCAALSKAGAELVKSRFSRIAARHTLDKVFGMPRCSVCGSDHLITQPIEGNYREAFVCRNCFALGRTEALARVLLERFTHHGERSLAELVRLRSSIHIHEFGFVGAIAETLRGQPGYEVSEFFEEVKPGTLGPGDVRCEDLTCLTFSDESFDVVISQDVLEHVPNPERAFSEIARVLKPGGSHVFTVPQDRNLSLSVTRAKQTSEGIEHLLPPEYHGDPIRVEGALVFTDFGTDLGAMHGTAGLHLIEHELSVLGGSSHQMLRVFEAIKAPIDERYK
jgi:GT2 family glycosyltransferase/glycosyltransferase involved in cell wall biosynthesis/SAM-dependent methyltransferase